MAIKKLIKTINGSLKFTVDDVKNTLEIETTPQEKIVFTGGGSGSGETITGNSLSINNGLLISTVNGSTTGAHTTSVSLPIGPQPDGETIEGTSIGTADVVNKVELSIASATNTLNLTAHRAIQTPLTASVVLPTQTGESISANSLSLDTETNILTSTITGSSTGAHAATITLPYGGEISSLESDIKSLKSDKQDALVENATNAIEFTNGSTLDVKIDGTTITKNSTTGVLSAVNSDEPLPNLLVVINTYANPSDEGNNGYVNVVMMGDLTIEDYRLAINFVDKTQTTNSGNYNDATNQTTGKIQNINKDISSYAIVKYTVVEGQTQQIYAQTFVEAIGGSGDGETIESVSNSFDTTTNTLKTTVVGSETGSHEGSVVLPTISQIQSDGNQTDSTKVDYIKNKPDLSKKQDKLNQSLNNPIILDDADELELAHDPSLTISDGLLRVSNPAKNLDIAFSEMNMDDNECVIMLLGDTTNRFGQGYYDFSDGTFSNIIGGTYDGVAFTTYEGEAFSGKSSMFVLVNKSDADDLNDIVFVGMNADKDTQQELYDFVRRSEAGGSLKGVQYDDYNQYLDVNVDNDTIVFNDSEATVIEKYSTPIDITPTGDSASYSGQITVGEIPTLWETYLQLDTTNTGQAGDGRAYLEIVESEAPNNVVGSYGGVPLGKYEIKIPAYVKQYLTDGLHSGRIINHDTIQATTPLTINSLQLVYYLNSESMIRLGNGYDRLVYQSTLNTSTMTTLADGIPEKYRSDDYRFELIPSDFGESYLYRTQYVDSDHIEGQLSNISTNHNGVNPPFDIADSLSALGYADSDGVHINRNLYSNLFGSLPNNTICEIISTQLQVLTKGAIIRIYKKATI